MGITDLPTPFFWREECDNLFGGVFSDLEESSVRAIKQNQLIAVIVTSTLQGCHKGKMKFTENNGAKHRTEERSDELI